MGKWLIPLFIVVPLLEVVFFIVSGNTIGIWPTILLIVLTGVVGIWLAKKEGTQVLMTARLKIQNGEVPQGIVLDGICILGGGILLIIPGFITDVLGFLLLLPSSRKLFKRGLENLFRYMIKTRNIIYIHRR
ncbi:FxsA family protein [Aliibacillus thermotolerans]|uniref:FxsA family protein n=1 Tax=Aliibacillus thermotolerans TaxID=1834418 RepID=A0ABW0U7N7_9BACI|nr:FxsA family protein [Aliibacillus thermotolerans]MDA3129823.1 membrane protein FxsA [Aliibacillus thermotolerans]